jgi:hypothetical protein
MSEPVRWLDDPASAPALRDAVRGLPAHPPELRAEVLGAVATNLHRAPASGHAAAIAGFVAAIVALSLVLSAVLRPAGEPSRDKTVTERAAIEAPDEPRELAVPDAARPIERAARVELRDRGRARERPAERRAVPTLRQVSAPAESEADLLRRARRALATDATAAFALASEHQTAYPRGALVLEREVVAIDALLRLGRTTEAQARRAELETSYPNTLYRERIDRLFRERE